MPLLLAASVPPCCSCVQVELRSGAFAALQPVERSELRHLHAHTYASTRDKLYVPNLMCFDSDTDSSSCSHEQLVMQTSRPAEHEQRAAPRAARDRSRTFRSSIHASTCRQPLFSAPMRVVACCAPDPRTRGLPAVDLCCVFGTAMAMPPCCKVALPGRHCSLFSNSPFFENGE